MNILSLFDGISCGRVALERAGIEVKKYYASEIDKFAQQISEKNYPDIKRLGDIRYWKEWAIDFKSIDLIFAGFPCQAWSVAGKGLGVDDPRGAIVFDLLDIFHHIKKVNPKVKFLFENVKMKKEFIEYINGLFGCEPIEINSALVSAQNRKRLYWTNIPNVTQPQDKGILLKDIVAWSKSTRYPEGKEKYIEQRVTTNGKANTLTTGAGCGSFSSKNFILKDNVKVLDENEYVDRDKSHCLDANYAKGTTKEQYLKKSRRQIVMQGLDGYRKLSPLECERLQTLPDNYTECVSNTQRYKAIGNGWTVDVIVHILKGLK